jgi:hypothetical protein
MTIDILKSELSKLDKGELLDVLQYGLEVMKEKEQGGFETPAWLKEAILERAEEMKADKTAVYSWQEVKIYAANG